MPKIDLEEVVRRRVERALQDCHVPASFIEGGVPTYIAAQVLDVLKFEWAVQWQTYTDGEFDRTDDGRGWMHRYGRPYTEEEAREEFAKRQKTYGDYIRLAKRVVGEWEAPE